MKSAVLFLLAGIANVAVCGEKFSMLGNEPRSHIQLTGNPHVDLVGIADFKSAPPQVDEDQDNEVSHRSPWLAAGLSLVLPGAGQIYTESYWEAAASVAVEVAAWVVASKYDKKGDRQTTFFEQYADNYWSVVNYAQWTLDNASSINPSVHPADYPNLFTSGGRGVNWNELNRLERDIGGWYTHTLPVYGEQQYYELIGKYPQFNQGWEGATPEKGESLPDGPRAPRDLYYEVERARADDYYGVAGTFVNVAIINHVLSAIDAAWSASRYNKFNARVGLQNVPTRIGYASVPVVKLSYSF